MKNIKNILNALGDITKPAEPADSVEQLRSCLEHCKQVEQRLDAECRALGGEITRRLSSYALKRPSEFESVRRLQLDREAGELCCLNFELNHKRDLADWAARMEVNCEEMLTRKMAQAEQEELGIGGSGIQGALAALRKKLVGPRSASRSEPAKSRWSEGYRRQLEDLQQAHGGLDEHSDDTTIP